MNAWRDLKGLPRDLWILCFATLVNRLGTMVLPFLVLYLTKNQGYSAAKAALVLSVYGGVALVAGPLGGRLSDRFGARLTMQLTLLLSAIILFLYPYAHSFSALIALTVLLAMTNEAFRPANMAIVGELGGEKRKAAFALHRFSVNLGMSIGPAAGGFLAQTSFPLIFAVDGITNLIAAGILFLCQKEKRTHLSGKQSVWLVDAFFSDKRLRIFLLGVLPVSLVFFQHQSSMALYVVRDLHFSEAYYGFLGSINCLLIILIEIPLNSATAHWSHRKSLAIGSFLFALGFGALAAASNYFFIAMTVVIWTFGEMILFPAMGAYVSDIAPKGKNGEYMGLYMMIFSLAFMAGPLLGTTALDRFGPVPLWIGTFFVGLISVWVLGRLREPAR